MPSHDDLAARLEATGDYRVLRRLVPVRAYDAAPAAATRQAVVVDTETTGLDPATDAIIQLAILPFRYDPKSGAVGEVGEAWAAFEDPGRPIPETARRLTGITDEMVRGQRIDDDAVAALVADAALVIAHNAWFDRRFLERRLPLFADKAWACSDRELGWKERFGYASAALEHLAYRHAGVFFDGHRADADVRATLHVLATPAADGTRPLQLLLESARTPLHRIWATGAPFETKDALRTRGYRWSGGEDGRPRAWWTERPAPEADAELDWLAEHAYGGRRDRWQVDVLTAKERYRDR
ncbi:MAG: 3'-5' exonuclease [Gemmatimonadales bacterium]|nr:3'-5' exonuclease [Gemmatimonadales bacterium]